MKPPSGGGGIPFVIFNLIFILFRAAVMLNLDASTVG
jgi:hypothetical protein